jgi:hypothetical protein
MVAPDFPKVTGSENPNNDESGHEKRGFDIDADNHRKIRHQKHADHEVQSAPQEIHEGR